MKIDKTEVYGHIPALRAMRNPMNSWDKTDTQYDSFNNHTPIVGENDSQLSRKLTNAGSEHCKHLRMIMCWVDMELPRYIHSELDTYKFNTHISCSTMHKITSRPLTRSDFEGNVDMHVLEKLNDDIQLYSNLKKYNTNKETLNQLLEDIKGDLPERFLQKRSYCFNYAELLNIYTQRKNHKLKIWHDICDWIINLPYFKELTGVQYVSNS